MTRIRARRAHTRHRLVMREIERSDNDALRAKKDIMEAFIRTRFYDLPEDADVQQAYEQFERENLRAEIESFAYGKGLEAKDVLDIFSEYMFNGSISDEAIRRRLTAYRMGLLKITKTASDVKQFVVNTYGRYKVEGE
ncbi:MAG: type I restriction endonuclease subunit R, EcoR124 family [Butyricicoccus sp.]